MASFGGDDILGLVAHLHRAALLRLSDAAGRKFQGLAMGGRHLKLQSLMQHKLRDIEACYGIVRKVSRQSIDDFLLELDKSVGSGKHPMSGTAQAVGDSDADRGGLEGCHARQGVHAVGATPDQHEQHGALQAVEDPDLVPSLGKGEPLSEDLGENPAAVAVASPGLPAAPALVGASAESDQVELVLRHLALQPRGVSDVSSGVPTFDQRSLPASSPASYNPSVPYPCGRCQIEFPMGQLEYEEKSDDYVCSWCRAPY